MTALKESYHQNMTLVEAEKLVLQTLKQVMEETITVDNVEVCVIRTDTKTLEYKSRSFIETTLLEFESDHTSKLVASTVIDT